MLAHNNAWQTFPLHSILNMVTHEFSHISSYPHPPPHTLTLPLIPSPSPSHMTAGVSTLDIRTRLRITEAELAIVQREVLDLLAERNALEASARQWEESWR